MLGVFNLDGCIIVFNKTIVKKMENFDQRIRTFQTTDKDLFGIINFMKEYKTSFTLLGIRGKCIPYELFCY